MSAKGSAAGHPVGGDRRAGAVPDENGSNQTPPADRRDSFAPGFGTGHIIYTVCVLLDSNTMNFYDRQVLSAVQEKIKHDWSLSDSQLGMLGTAFILLYAVIGLPLGHLADVWRRKWLLSLGVAVWSLFTIASGLAWGFW